MNLIKKLIISNVKYVVLLLLIIIYLFKANEARFIQDDSYTSLRYAQNFTEGNGLVFNIGERVEGYTNFLWVLLLSFIKIFANVFKFEIDLPFIAQILSIVFGITTLLATYLISKEILKNKLLNEFGSSLFALLCTSMVLFTTPFIYWSVSGMETSLFVTLTLLGVYFSLDFSNSRKRKYFIIISIFNSFLRPEGMFFFFLLLSFVILEKITKSEQAGLNKRIKNGFNKDVRLAFVIYAIPILLFLVFRLIYYGYPFPNTFYAKTEFTINFLQRGWDYFSDFAEDYLLYGLFFLPILLQFFSGKSDRKEKIVLAFSFIYIISIILIGGDVLPIYRFFLPVMPLLFILFINSLLVFVNSLSSRKINYLIMSLLFVSVLIYSPLNYYNKKPFMIEKRGYEIGLVNKMKIYAEWVNNYGVGRNKQIVAALSTIGAFSFYSNVHVVDIVGLTDEYVAHNPKEVNGIDEQLPVLWKERHYNADYVLSHKPDYIIFPAGAKPSAFAECALFVNDEFFKNYYTQVFFSSEMNQLLPIFTRKDNVRNDSSKCSISFLTNYINANSLFIKMLNKKDKNLLHEIVNNLDEVTKKCRKRSSEANTLKGMSFFHFNYLEIAKKYFLDANRQDSTNCISRFYLMNLYFKQSDYKNANNLINEIIKYSPYALPNYVKEFKEN